MEDVNIVCVAFLVSEEYSITHYKLKDCLDLRQNEEATSDTATAINGYTANSKYRWPKNIWIREKSVYTAKFSGYKSFWIQKFSDSKVPTLDCGFKISGDMGYFHFGFVLLCVNGKTNPVLKLNVPDSSRIRNNFL